MKAGEKTFQGVLYGPDQYLIPIFQRYYVWKLDNWRQLWDDINELMTLEHPTRHHFMGSLACVQTTHQPGEVPGYLVIDGQQRLITISLLLCAIRDIARDMGLNSLADEVHNSYLIHPYKQGYDKYKLFPRQLDRTTYFSIVNRENGNRTGLLLSAYEFHIRAIKKGKYDESESSLRGLFNTIGGKLDFVVITLGNESPFKIFQSLNSTGQDLSQADLIRNHVFMSVPIDQHDSFHENKWRVLEAKFENEEGKLNDGLFTAFFRDYMQMSGEYTRKDEVFDDFANRYKTKDMNYNDLLENLIKYSVFYEQIVGRKAHSHEAIEDELKSLRDLDVTTAYPVVLKLLGLCEDNKISDEELLKCLKLISSFVLRRAVCGEGSKSYSRWFCSECKSLEDKPVEQLLNSLTGRGWPSNTTFIEQLKSIQLYNKSFKAYVLHRIELSMQAASEKVSLDKSWIEHVLPDTVENDDNGEAWKDALGEEWERIYTDKRHTIGNLTLVGYDYNIGMRNYPFIEKKPVLIASKIYMNIWFKAVSEWNEDEISRRADDLCKRACNIWADTKSFKPVNAS